MSAPPGPAAMRFRALATDYDGTLATQGRVPPSTIAAIERLRATGRAAILATGREVADWLSVFERPDVFDLVVAENGAVLYDPRTNREKPLAGAFPERFAAALRERGVQPLRVGRVVAATWETEAPKVLDAIQSLGLEYRMIFNKGSLMVLPSGVNKATGLAAGLERLGLNPRSVVGVGDAENDEALLSVCGCGVAVANALPSLKARANLVTAGDHGAGVEELIEALVRDDLAACPPVRVA